MHNIITPQPLSAASPHPLPTPNTTTPPTHPTINTPHVNHSCDYSSRTGFQTGNHEFRFRFFLLERTWGLMK
ncbi:hypothetical protein BC938DRAFT_472610 [Jimgerdemannia flammicorona]|uniref:Uncharacterized protein n=1 Tax=Jimgerdemannia flammicorona TaxID=994334 RepID=A0A433Q5R4_9FUNG|nr:hypothetical protein BC938DRAFT_472610 [Jimgerdemannia flammicorona]